MSRFVAPRPGHTGHTGHTGRFGAQNTLSLGRSPKPRNPFVAAARQRSAGSHAQGDARQSAQRELREALAELLRSP